MAGHQTAHSWASELDPHDPQFPQKATLSNCRMRCELMETIAASKDTIARSRAMLAEADRVLGNRALVDSGEI